MHLCKCWTAKPTPLAHCQSDCPYHSAASTSTGTATPNRPKTHFWILTHRKKKRWHPILQVCARIDSGGVLPWTMKAMTAQVPNLFHLRVVRRRDTIEVGGDLGSKVLNADHRSQPPRLDPLAMCALAKSDQNLQLGDTDANERLQDVLGHHIRVASLSNVFAVDVPQPPHPSLLRSSRLCLLPPPRHLLLSRRWFVRRCSDDALIARTRHSVREANVCCSYGEPALLPTTCGWWKD